MMKHVVNMGLLIVLMSYLTVPMSRSQIMPIVRSSAMEHGRVKDCLFQS